MALLKSRWKILFAAYSLLLLSGCSTFSYVVDTGIGQWKLMNRARPVEEVLQSPTTKEETKKAIRLVLAAKKFAVEDLGLKATHSYKEYVQLDAPYVSWAVSASDALKLEERKWKFFVVGALPYLGFFTEEKAKRFAEKLKAEPEKPDVWIRGVPAFSSLGWFSDPLYSSMIEDSERDIVDLVIHESLHATVWVGDSVDFNEKLANFVGLEGSIAYLKKEDPSGASVKAARNVVAGEKIFAAFMQDATERYKREVQNYTDKETFYEGLRASYERFYEKQKKEWDTPNANLLNVKFTNWNNAALLAYANYYSDFSVFEKLLTKCNGNIARFVRWIVQEKESAEKNKGRFLERPEEYLASLLQQQQSCVP